MSALKRLEAIHPRTLTVALSAAIAFSVVAKAADKPPVKKVDPSKPVDLPSADKPILPSFKKIFDGKTTTGWKAIGGGEWKVVDGAVVGKTGDGAYGWLIYEKPVADFILELECKLDDHGNSGIQFRSHVLGKDMCGYQADFDPDNEKVGGTGGIYDEGPGLRGWLFKPDLAKVKKIQKPLGEWNKYKIQAIGDRLQTWLNGELIADIRDHQARSGIIALQVHSGKTPPVNANFRKIRLADLGDGGDWKPIFDGKSLKGWHTQGEPGVWRVEEGQIIGELVKPSPYAYLATDGKYDDFELKMQMKFDSDTGNSGVFFRCSFPPWCEKCKEVARNLPEDIDPAQFKCPKCGHNVTKTMADRVHIHGPQAEFAPAKHDRSPTAAIYDARGHGWINFDQVTDHMRAMNHEKEWNELRLLCRGNHVMAWLNGFLVSDISDYDFPKTGIIALQMHETKEAIKVRFKDLQVREAD